MAQKPIPVRFNEDIKIIFAYEKREDQIPSSSCL